MREYPLKKESNSDEVSAMNGFSALCIAGTSSGDGKTTVTLALLRALVKRKLNVQPFKCGPDYIDPTFHNIAAHRHSRNLDCWMMGAEQVKRSFAGGITEADCAVIEGVMGMFDSAAPGSLEGSTAEVASLLDVPVILTVNCRGMAGSIAAIVKGYTEFCDKVKVVGVIANMTGSETHAAILRRALELANLPPLLGYLPRNEHWALPERHLGLVPFIENEKSDEWFEQLGQAAEQYFDIDWILALCRMEKIATQPKTSHPAGARLAIARDEAFHFYYQDNLDILRENGFELVDFSPIHDLLLPDNIQGIYLGGGFPEVFAAGLEENSSMRQAIKNFAGNGGAIYAECGGFMYLTERLTDNAGKSMTMCGVIPARTFMGERLGSFGYREAKTCEDTFFGPAGTIFKGHEFHWSDVEFNSVVEPLWLTKGSHPESEWSPCGYNSGNVCASYIHLHFASNLKAIASMFHCIVSR
jgi:cobyrinic acid a,c-diamide synthase